jgi:uncharacterized protein DUF4145
MDDPPPPSTERSVDAIIWFLRKAREYAATEPVSALAFSRKAAEAVCQHLWHASGAASTSPQITKFNDLIQCLASREVIPSRLVAPFRAIQGYGNYGSHPGTELPQLTPEYSSPCLAALMQIAHWFFEEHLRISIPSIYSWDAASASEFQRRAKQPPHGNVVVASLHDYLASGRSLDSLLEQTIRIDYETIENLDDQHEGHHVQWNQIVSHSPDTLRLLLEIPSYRIIGYWHFVPLIEEDYEAARAGKLFDASLTPDRIPLLLFGGTHRIYFVVISILPRYRSHRTLRLLIESFLELLIDLAEQGIFVEEICTNAFTQAGEGLCRTVGMTHACNHQEKGKIYTLRLLPLKGHSALKGYPKLIELYNAARP